MRQQVFRASDRRSGFTLIEILIVVGIMALLVSVLMAALMGAFGESNVQATENYLQNIANGVATLKRNNLTQRLTAPGSFVRPECTQKFIKATAIGEHKTYRKLTQMQRAKVLAFVLAPSREQWEEIVTDDKRGRMSYKPPLSEENTQGMMMKDDDGFAYFVDAWDQPISYDVVTTGSGSQKSVVIVLISGGPDESIEEQADNLNYSAAKKHYEGAFK